MIQLYPKKSLDSLNFMAGVRGIAAMILAVILFYALTILPTPLWDLSLDRLIDLILG